MECFICSTELSHDNSIRLECSHSHCRGCLQRNFSVSLTSAPFQPVRCCDRSPVKTTNLRNLVMWNMAKLDDLQLYRKRLGEYLDLDKLYCHVHKCNAFIPSALRTSSSGKCAKCLAKTCRSCKGKFHFGRCTSNIAPGSSVASVVPSFEELFLVLAKKSGWKQCPQCGNWVQKNGGCNHIICRCGCEFCYRCGRAPYGNHGPCAM